MTGLLGLIFPGKKGKTDLSAIDARNAENKKKKEHEGGIEVKFEKPAQPAPPKEKIDYFKCIRDAWDQKYPHGHPGSSVEIIDSGKYIPPNEAQNEFARMAYGLIEAAQKEQNCIEPHSGNLERKLAKLKADFNMYKAGNPIPQKYAITLKLAYVMASEEIGKINARASNQEHFAPTPEPDPELQKRIKNTR